MVLLLAAGLVESLIKLQCCDVFVVRFFSSPREEFGCLFSIPYNNTKVLGGLEYFLLRVGLCHLR